MRHFVPKVKAYVYETGQIVPLRVSQGQALVDNEHRFRPYPDLGQRPERRSAASLKLPFSLPFNLNWRMQN